MSVSAAKKVLRKSVKLRVKQLSECDKKNQSEAVVQKVLSLEEYTRSRRVCVYLSMPDEVQTESLLQNALNAGKVVYVPRYLEPPPPRMDMVRLLSMQDYTQLSLTAWNIRQPGLDEPREDAFTSGGLDLVLVPGLAFSQQGARLGRGKGFYDTFFQRYKAEVGPLPKLIGLAFNEQIYENVPREEHDMLLDRVLYRDDL